MIVQQNNINIDSAQINSIIDTTVAEVFQDMNIQSVTIKQKYYQSIAQLLKEIEVYFVQTERIAKTKRSSKLSNPYAPEYGFSTTEIAYAIQAEKKEQAIIYNKLNQILAYLRQGQEITYSFYIKDTQNRMYRYEIPESQIDTFTSIVQQTTFKADAQLREFAEVSIQRLENAQIMNKHIEAFMKAIDATGLKVKQADRYEAFEYHYQMIDNKNKENFSHSFNIEGIRKWILARGHDTVGWWVRGDIGLTSVKSTDLTKKYLFLNLASKKSLQEVYGLLKQLFAQDSLSQEGVSRLVKAFTPAVSDLKKNTAVDVKKIVEDLINSLIK